MPEIEKSKPNTLSRRDFLRNAGIMAGGTVVGSAIFLSACGETKEITRTVTTTAPGSTSTLTTTAPGGTATQTVSKYVCPVCSKEYDSLAALKSHFDASHPSEGSIYISYPPPKKMVQVDPYYCRSCSTCAAICSARAWGESSPALSAIKFSQDRMTGKVQITTCHQCAAPSCMQACPVEGAMYINEATGARVINQSKCTGCRECEYACPFDAVVYNPKVNKCFKCDLCGGNPMCVDHCTSGEVCLKLADAIPVKGGL